MTGVARRDVSVLVAAEEHSELRATLRALADQDLQGCTAEVVVVARGDGAAASGGAASGQAGDLPVSVIEDAAAGAAAGINAGLMRTSGRIVLLLGAGDLPVGSGLLAGHVAAHGDPGVRAVAGAVRPESPVVHWVGRRPALAPAGATRHLSIDRALLVTMEGLDDRLRDLDVAAVDLLARVCEAGHRVQERPDLAVDAPPRACEAMAVEDAGRAATALDRVLEEAGRPVADPGRPHTRVALRWARLALGLAGRRTSGPRAQRARFAYGRGAPWLPVSDLDRIGLPVADRQVARPAVSVIVPFAGDAGAGERLLTALAAIRRRSGDEVLIVDNSRLPAVPERDGVHVVRAHAEQSSYYARNAGAQEATAPWLLFTDADCLPVPWILDAFFQVPPDRTTGAVAGAVLEAPGRGWIHRYSTDGLLLHQPRGLAHPFRPYGVTANLLVRREAWSRVGGFAEGIRSGGDAEFCWRLQEDGWTLGWCPRAVVHHEHRTTLSGLLRQYRRYGAGVGWLGRRERRVAGLWPVVPPGIARSVAHDLAAGRPRAALTQVLDLACVLAAMVGTLHANRPSGEASAGSALRPHGATASVCAWPDAGNPEAIAAIARLAREDVVAVEARRRPLRIDRRASDLGLHVAYREDDGPADRAAALAWALRRPGRVAALFATGAALRELAGDAAVARRLVRRGSAPLCDVDGPSGERVAHLAGVSLRRRDRAGGGVRPL